MSKVINHTREIDSYLAGELSPDETAAVEKKLLEDYSFREDLEVTKRLIRAIRGYGFRQMLEKLQREQLGGNGNDVDAGTF